MTTTARYVQGATLPNLDVFWPRADGTGPVDFSSGWTFSVDCGDPGLASESGFPHSNATGATGSGLGNNPSADVPNLVVDWSSSDLGALEPGNYTIEVEATNAGEVRVLRIPLQILPRIGSTPT